MLLPIKTADRLPHYGKYSISKSFWEYSRNKIEAEEVLMTAYRTTGFPVTIVRPSHTYNGTKPPVSVHGAKGNWQILKRILDGKPVIIPGDGSSLWTLTHSKDFAKDMSV